MMKKAKMVIKVSLLQMMPSKIIAFVFSMLCVSIFFLENIHVPDDLQPSLAVFIFLFWNLFWDIVILRGIGISVKNQ